MACSRKAKCYTVIGIGIAFLIIAVVLIVGYPYLFGGIVKSKLALSKDSLGFDTWKKTPVPLYLDVYLFHWTNPEAVEKDWNVKPIFEEKGPYVFSESHERVDLVWNSNGTITFNQTRTWHFQPDLSKGQLNDSITNLNPVAATVAHVARYLPSYLYIGINFMFSEFKEKLTVTKTAKELIFDGYEDPLLVAIKNISTSFNVPYTKFGWFVERNGSSSYDGIFNMYTGVDDISKLGVLDKWNRNSQVPYYKNDCGKVTGTTGEIWPPVQSNVEHLFVTDICSSLYLNYEGSAEKLGVEGAHFVGTERMFDNGTSYPDLKCFSPGDAVPSGLRNISECQHGAPAFFSFPHFYLADPSYRERIVGMHPDQSLHELYVDLEPLSGVPLDVRARAQINLLIQPIKGINLFKNVKETFFPMMWFAQRTTITDDYASQVKTMLTLKNLGMYTGYGIGAIGILLIFIGVILIFSNNRKGNDRELLIQTNQST